MSFNVMVLYCSLQLEIIGVTLTEFVDIKASNNATVATGPT